MQSMLQNHMWLWLTGGRGSKLIIVDQHRGLGEGDKGIEVMLNIYFKWLLLGKKDGE